MSACLYLGYRLLLIFTNTIYYWHCVSFWYGVGQILTLSPPIPLRLYTLPYWSNPPFLIFDIRALWRSGLSVLQSARMSISSSAMAERPRELDQRFQVGVNLKLNYILNCYFSRHCHMTQYTLTHHMVNKPFLLLGLAAEYRSRRSMRMRSTLRPTIRCLWHSPAN